MRFWGWRLEVAGCEVLGLEVLRLSGFQVLGLEGFRLGCEVLRLEVGGCEVLKFWGWRF